MFHSSNQRGGLRWRGSCPKTCGHPEGGRETKGNETRCCHRGRRSGLEAAWELKKAKCEVTVLELAPVLMGRQLDREAGEMLQKISEGQGIRIHTGVQIEAIEGEGSASGVRLADGTVFPAELVIVSCGVRANTAIAKEAGIGTDRAVIVNEKMETSLPDIYACGDCAQYEGMNYAIWPQALEEGKVAGAQAAGMIWFTKVFRRH